MKNIRMVLLITMVVFTIGLIGVAGWMFFSNDGFIDSFRKQENEIRVYVQMPPSVELGNDLIMVITVHNIGKENITIEEIRLPQELLEAAVVKNIFPGSIVQTEFDNISTGFKIDFLIGADEQREFEVVLQPWQAVDVSGEVEVVTGEASEKCSFRTMIRKAVVVVPTFTAIPTATMIPTATSTAIAPTATQVAIPYQSVVKIIAKVKHSSYLKPIWGGSGTIVSSDGLILTNAHLVAPSENFRADAYIIAISHAVDTPPVETYYAEPVKVDRDMDLAVLRIMLDIDQKPVNRDELNLPAVPGFLAPMPYVPQIISKDQQHQHLLVKHFPRSSQVFV